MNFALFVLLNAVLLIRPEELLPSIAGLRLYLIVIAGCLLTTGSRILEKLRPGELAAQPITVCVLGVWAAGILSQLARGQLGLAADFAGDFGKVVLYYLLLVSVLESVGRVRAFLGWIVVFVVVISTLGLLQYHGVIDNEALRPLERKDYRSELDTEEADVFLQLRGTGIYNDPNDLCLILVTGSLCALYRAVSAGGWIGRLLWLAPIGLFGYAVVLTQSRGGLLGLAVAAFAWAYGRFGWKRTLFLAAALAPAPALLLSGRLADIGLGKGDTAHERFELWSEGLVALMQNPVTGIGVGEYADVAGLVAHNSFVHAYVEMGLLGGSLFLAAFFLSALGLHRVKPVWSPPLVLLRPFVFAIVIGYAGGVFSISRNYVVPTYLVLGLAASYFQLVRPSLPLWFRCDGRMAVWMAGLGVVGLLGLKLLTVGLLASGR